MTLYRGRAGNGEWQVVVVEADGETRPLPLRREDVVEWVECAEDRQDT